MLLIKHLVYGECHSPFASFYAVSAWTRHRHDRHPGRLASEAELCTLALRISGTAIGLLDRIPVRSGLKIRDPSLECGRRTEEVSRVQSKAWTIKSTRCPVGDTQLHVVGAEPWNGQRMRARAPSVRTEYDVR